VTFRLFVVPPLLDEKRRLRARMRLFHIRALCDVLAAQGVTIFKARCDFIAAKRAFLCACGVLVTVVICVFMIPP
ncbi:MAG: hypothetical protein CUN54_10270, partial [Phototrophicales bacterium]